MSPWLVVFLVLISFWLGVIVSAARYAKASEPVGFLRIDRSIEEDAPYLFLELKKPVDQLLNKSIVTLEVKAENFISQN